jgi:hypothetical protein
VSLVLESYYLQSIRAGIALRSPLHDPEIVELAWRLPPEALILGERLKGISYEALAREVGSRTAYALRPIWVDALFARTLRREGVHALETLEGVPRLAALDLVSEKRLKVALAGDEQGGTMDYYPAWRALTTEAWLQARWA